MKSRTRALSIAAGLFLASAAHADEAEIFRQRMAWWAVADHVLDVKSLSPLETVAGRPGPALPTADPERRTISTAALASAIAYVRPLNTQSLLVWQDGALQLEWYGDGFGPASRSSPASMMKPVMALAVGAAVDRGLIKSADDPVSTYLPEWRGDPRGAITVRQLLQMTGGLKKDGPTSGGGRGAELMLGTQLQKTLLETPLATTPGEVFEYNNAAPGLLGVILERATGKRYADWLSQSVWRPIGAADAAVWLDRAGGLARTYCCLITTGRDWLRTGLLIKDHGRAQGRQVVSSAWVDAMIAPSPRNPNFGYDIWRASPYQPHRGYGTGAGPTVPAAQPFLAEDMVYFDGAVGERVYISRRYNLVIVRIGASAPTWDDSLLPNLIVAGLKTR